MWGMGDHMVKKKILVVDDEKAFTELVKTTLEETGKFEVRTENKGRQSFDIAREFGPDLILLDMVMPDMDGSYVADQIRSDEVLGDVPIIFLTAVVREEETRTGGGFIGGYPFIAKPVGLTELIERIEENLP